MCYLQENCLSNWEGKCSLCRLNVCKLLLASNAYVMNQCNNFHIAKFNLGQYDTFGNYKFGRVVDCWLRIAFFSFVYCMREKEECDPDRPPQRKIRKVSIICRKYTNTSRDSSWGLFLYKFTKGLHQHIDFKLSQTILLFTFFALFPLLVKLMNKYLILSSIKIL